MTRCEEPPPGNATDFKPFTVAVVDRKSGKPVTEFSYVVGYKAPGRVNPRKKEWHPIESSPFSLTLVRTPVKRNWQRVESLSGTFVVQAPVACLLGIGVQTHDYLADSNRYHEFQVRSTDRERRAVVELERGATVHGTVRDATTRRPIAGVTVRPKAPHFNIYLGSEERETKSDWVGQYQLHGVNLELGISALHPENGLEGFGVDVKKGEGALFDVYVTPLDHCNLKGTVRDSSGPASGRSNGLRQGGDDETRR